MYHQIAAEMAEKETEQKEAGNINVSRKKEIKVGKFREKKEERLSKKQSAASQPKKKYIWKKKTDNASLESKSTFKCHNFLNINV